ncbi:MAG: hypothetical protein FWD23_15670 [Oscillospiraceae bacterium]|nr:hypothetical protein [Oscillospiraceae bacterium]
MGKNITIPYSLFSKIVALLESWDISHYCQYTQEEYFDVIFALEKKQKSIELREAYSNIINAESEEQRHNARMRYLMEKRNLREQF